jgi:hypothetical protein
VLPLYQTTSHQGRPHTVRSLAATLRCPERIIRMSAIDESASCAPAFMPLQLRIAWPDLPALAYAGFAFDGQHKLSGRSTIEDAQKRYLMIPIFRRSMVTKTAATRTTPLTMFCKYGSTPIMFMPFPRMTMMREPSTVRSMLP